MAAVSEKLRILCFHGWKQDVVSFRNRLNALRRALDKHAELEFIQAPYELPSDPITEAATNANSPIVDGLQQQQKRLFTWWNSNHTPDIAHTLAYIDSFWKEKGPFDGVLGFSQGAAVVALLCSLQSKQQRISSSPTSYGKSSASVGALEPFDSIDDVSSAEREAACAPVLNYQFQSVRFRFAMVAGGFVPRREELGSLFDDIGVPSLHVVGITDEIITPDSSYRLAESFRDPVIVRHAGGHYIPTMAECASQYRDFLAKQLANA